MNEPRNPRPHRGAPSGGGHGIYGELPAPHGREPDGVPLHDIVGVVRRHAGLIAGVMILCTVIAAVLVYLDEPEYRATAVVRMSDDRGSMTRGIEERPVDRSRGVDPLLSETRILHSRGLAGEVVDAVGLRLRIQDGAFPFEALEQVKVTAPPAATDTLELRLFPDRYEVRRGEETAHAPYGMPVSVSGVSFALTGRPGGVDRARIAVLARERAIDRLHGNLRIQPLTGSDIIEVEYTAAEPALAQRVVNGLVQTYRAESADNAQESSRRRRLFLETQLAQTDSMLRQASAALNEFRNRTGVYRTGDRMATQQAAALELELRREKLLVTRRLFESLLGELRAGGPPEGLGALVSALDVADNPTLSQLLLQLMSYQRGLDSLSAGPWGASPENPDVARMQSLVDQTLGKLRTAIAAHVTSLDTQIRALDQSHGRLAAEINQLPDIEAEETQKTRQVQTLQAMVDNLRLEHQRARIQEAVQAGRVDIVDLAPRPYLPVGMGTRFKLFVGLMLGLMLGVGTAFGRELMNRSIRGREQLEEIAPVPGLAVIPRLVPASNGRLRLRPGRKERDEAVAAEAYRILNANLQVTAGDVGFRTVVVTSAVPAEGKTTTATNLARLLAEHGERVLLVDADLRVGELHKEFQVARKPGLAELLAGTAPVQGVIRETNAPGLHVIPRGTYQPDHGHALAPGRVLSVLGELSSLYDSILLDTAPVLTVAEARIFAACAPAVLLVVRAGRTDRELVLRALQELESVGARVIGTVLNDSNAEIRETGAYGYAYMTSR